MSDLGGLQLLPSQKRTYSLHVQGNSRLLLIAFIFLIALAIAYGSIRIASDRAEDKVTDVEKSIMAIYKKRDKAAEEKLMSFQKQLTTTRELLQAHTTWATGFVGIQKLIEPRMKFSSLEADSDKRSYRFQAMADSYATVAKQIAIFYGSPLIQDVKIGTINGALKGQVDVTMELTLSP